jgi:hypothetical protein
MVFGTSIWWLVAAVLVYMVVGALWYSPLLFAGPWMKAVGKSTDDMKGGSFSMYAVPAVGAVIVTVTLAFLADSMGLHGWTSGAVLGIQMWLAFAATTALTNRVFQGGSMQLFAIDLGYHLVGFIAAGALVVH